MPQQLSLQFRPHNEALGRNRVREAKCKNERIRLQQENTERKAKHANVICCSLRADRSVAKQAGQSLPFARFSRRSCPHVHHVRGPEFLVHDSH